MLGSQVALPRKFVIIIIICHKSGLDGFVLAFSY
jgi:hypothetical protein